MEFLNFFSSIIELWLSEVDRLSPPTTLKTTPLQEYLGHYEDYPLETWKFCVHASCSFAIKAERFSGGFPTEWSIHEA